MFSSIAFRDSLIWATIGHKSSILVISRLAQKMEVYFHTIRLVSMQDALSLIFGLDVFDC